MRAIWSPKKHSKLAGEDGRLKTSKGGVHDPYQLDWKVKIYWAPNCVLSLRSYFLFELPLSSPSMCGSSSRPLMFACGWVTAYIPSPHPPSHAPEDRKTRRKLPVHPPTDGWLSRAFGTGVWLKLVLFTQFNPTGILITLAFSSDNYWTCWCTWAGTICKHLLAAGGRSAWVSWVMCGQLIQSVTLPTYQTVASPLAWIVASVVSVCPNQLG